MEAAAAAAESAADDLAVASSAREYARNSLRLAFLRSTVPAQESALHALLTRQFSPEHAHEYVLRASDRALDSMPPRVGPELLNWGRRCDVPVAVPAAWLVANGARFIAGSTHRRETLALLLSCWAARRELSALESGATSASSLPPAQQLWVVDFRRVASPAAAMCGPIPVCSLDGKAEALIGARHAAHMRARSPRLADALRIGYANHEHWREAAIDEALRAERHTYVASPGGVECRSLVYFLDTYDAASAHRPGAMASQVYVGLVGTSAEGPLSNTLARRAAQHLAGDELLVDMELQNPALWRTDQPAADDGDGEDDQWLGQENAPEEGPTPAALLLPLDFGAPGLHGRDSVGWLEGASVLLLCAVYNQHSASHCFFMACSAVHALL